MKGAVMQTAVVSGRVDIETKRKVDAVLRDTGVTAGDVIKLVWSDIAQTGQLPTSEAADKERVRRARVLEELRDLCDSMPPCPELARLDDAGIKEMMVNRDV